MIAVDTKFMVRALELARKGHGFVAPNPMVGAVLVKDGQIVAEGWHKKYGDVHAEVDCLEKHDQPLTGEEVLYVTLEPCFHHGQQPPCAQYLLNKSIKKIVVAMLDPNPKVAGQGVEQLKQAGVEVEVGCQENMARDLNKGFIMRMEKQRPYFILKVACTMQGQIAPIPRQRFAITSTESKQFTNKLRGTVDAILVGRQTVLIDNPELAAPGNYQPLRLVWGKSDLDEIPVDYLMKRDGNWQYLQANNIQDLVAQINVNTVLVEGGAQILQSFVKTGFVDELYVGVNKKLPGFADGLVAFVDDLRFLSSYSLETMKCGNDCWWHFKS